MQAFLLLLKKSSKVKVRDPREDPTWFMHKNLEFFCFFFCLFQGLGLLTASSEYLSGLTIIRTDCWQKGR